MSQPIDPTSIGESNGTHSNNDLSGLTQSSSQDQASAENQADLSEAETIVLENRTPPKQLRRLKRIRDQSPNRSSSSWNHSTIKNESESLSGDDFIPLPSHSKSHKSSYKPPKRSTTPRPSHSRSESPALTSTTNILSSANNGLINSRKSRTGRDANGRLKLQRMCDKGKYEEAKILVENGADVNDRDYAGNTALHEAALKGHFDLVKLLIDNNAIIDIRSGPDDLDTPLIDSSSNDHVDVVKLLLERGADPRIFNAHGKTALDSIQPENKHSREIEALLKEAILKFRKTTSSVGVSGSPRGNGEHFFDDVDQDPANSVPGTFPDPEVHGIYNHTHGNNEIKSSVSKRRGARSQAIRNDLLWMDLTTRTGREKVYQHAADGDIEFVGNFLENGWKPDADCLVLAAKHGHTDVVGILLAFGAQVDGINEEGLTALQQTIGRGHIDTVRLLLESGADPRRTDPQHRSSLDLAREAVGSDDEEFKLISKALKSYSGSDTVDEQDRLARRRRLEKSTDSTERRTQKKRKLVQNLEKETVRIKTEDTGNDFKRPPDNKALKEHRAAKEVKEFRELKGHKEKERSDLHRSMNVEVNTAIPRHPEPPLSSKSPVDIKHNLNDVSGRTELKEQREKESSSDKGINDNEKVSTQTDKIEKTMIEKFIGPQNDLASSHKAEKIIQIDEQNKKDQVQRLDHEKDPRKAQEIEITREKEKEANGTSGERSEKPENSEHQFSEDQISQRPQLSPQLKENTTSNNRLDSKTTVLNKTAGDKKEKTHVSDEQRPAIHTLNNLNGTKPVLISVDKGAGEDKRRVKAKDLQDNNSLGSAVPNSSVREMLEVQKEKERKIREKRMLQQLEEEDKRREEKRKRDLEIEEEKARKLKEQEEIMKAKEAELEQERERTWKIRLEAEARKSLPYGLRVMSYMTHTPEQSLRYLPLLVRSSESAGSLSNSLTNSPVTSPGSSYSSLYFLDVQITLFLGLHNIHESYPDLTRRLVTDQEKTRIWSLLIPWLCRPIPPYSDFATEEIIQERTLDRKRFMAITVFWLKVDQIVEILRKDFADMYPLLKPENLVTIDLDYDETPSANTTTTSTSPTINNIPQSKSSISLPVKVRMKMDSANRRLWG